MQGRKFSRKNGSRDLAHWRQRVPHAAKTRLQQGVRLVEEFGVGDAPTRAFGGTLASVHAEGVMWGVGT